MNLEKIIEELEQKINIENIKKDEVLAEHTTYKIGGAADLFIAPKNKEEIIHAVKVCRENEVDFFILGKGSNVLVSDEGYRGVVINIKNNFSKIEVNGEEVYAEAGAGLINVSYEAFRNSLFGLEFACGIPGTIGGAVCMNAGAYRGEMKQVIIDVEVLDENNEIKIIPNEEMKFDYRHSIVQEKGYIVLSVRMKLERGNKEELETVRERLKEHRINGQPIGLPNAGSVFKRPEGYFPGKIIEDIGLKGYTIGDAQVSEKHANFIINTGNATAKDVLNLINYVKEKVMNEYGIELKTEVMMLGKM